MMIETEYLLIALGLLLLYVIYYVLSKDAQQARQIRAIASAVEEANRRMFMLEKRLGERIDAAQAQPSEEPGLHDAVENRIHQVAAQLSRSVIGIEEGITAFKVETDKRLAHLEEGLRHLSMPASVTGMDDEKIITLYKQGIPLDAIAKELRLSKAEVEFVLKINKIR